MTSDWTVLDSSDRRLQTDTFAIDDLVSRVLSGRIRIPSFQRGLRWTLSDAIRLFDSILRGYPVGNLLLWSRPAKAHPGMRIGAVRIDAPALESALFVVDGQQRLTTLASALASDSEHDQRFAISYDMRRDQFVPSKETSNTQIPLPVVFDLAKLLDWFNERPELRQFPEYFERTTRVAKAIREFRVPVYIVDHGEQEVLRDIFDRMNNYGKQLTRAEVFTALHELDGESESSSDPVHQFEVMAGEVHAATGFGFVDADTCLLAMLARRGPDISRDIRREFTGDPIDDSARIKKRSIDFPNESADTAYEQATAAMVLAVRFLQNHADLPHLAFLPYRYLLVVLTRFFAHFPEPTGAQQRNLRRWFWRAASLGPEFSRGNLTASTRMLCARILPGRPDASLHGLLQLLGKTPPHRPIGRFRTNQADSRLVLAALWALGPRKLSLHGDGAAYTVSELLSALGEGSSAVDQAAMLSDSKELTANERGLAGNRLLLAEPAASAPECVAEPIAILGSLAGPEGFASAVLESHLLTADDAASLAQGADRRVVRSRQERVSVAVTDFVAARAEWTHEDTPDLDSLLLDQVEERG